jgi:hypothetical protein
MTGPFGLAKRTPEQEKIARADALSSEMCLGPSDAKRAEPKIGIVMAEVICANPPAGEVLNNGPELKVRIGNCGSTSGWNWHGNKFAVDDRARYATGPAIKSFPTKYNAHRRCQVCSSSCAAVLCFSYNNDRGGRLGLEHAAFYVSNSEASSMSEMFEPRWRIVI